MEPHPEQGECGFASQQQQQQQHTTSTLSVTDRPSSSHCPPAPQCDQLVAEGAIAAATPAEVVQQCDITFAMLADPEAALKVRTMCACAAAATQGSAACMAALPCHPTLTLAVAHLSAAQLGPTQAALGAGGVVDGLSAGKGYVDMSTVDEATSGEIAAAVAAKGGRFLEVRTC